MPGTVADLILEQLAQYGVGYIFGVIGDAIFPLADALSRQGRIRFVATTVETAAAFMASNYAKLTGNLGVCLGTSGPGASNLLNGIGEAYRDGAPLLCLTGQVATGELGTDSNQDLKQNQLFSALTNDSRLCVNPKALIPILTELVNQALSLKTAVHLSIPKDVLAAPADGSPIQPPPLITGLNCSGSVQGDLNKVILNLRDARQPILVIGKTARDLAKELLELADSAGIGIILALDNKGAVPDQHPLVLGGIGEAFLPGCLSEADLALLFGETVLEEKFFPPGTKFIRIQSSIIPGKSQLDTIRGDLGKVISKLKEEFSVRHIRQEWRNKLSEAHYELMMVDRAYQNQKHPIVFFRALSEAVSENAILSLDVGEFIYWFNPGFLAKTQQFLLSTYWRGMGGGIPAGIAACLHQTQRQVITIVGDGGLMMSLAELATVVSHNLPLTIVVLKNNRYGLEEQKMAKEGFTPFGLSVSVPDLPKLAAAFGLSFFQAQTPDAYHEKIRAALANTPALVEVEVEPTKLPNL